MHTNNNDPGKKPFPWRCGNCGEQAVYGSTLDCTRTMHHDNREYTVTVAGLKTPRCVKCGQIMLDNEALEVLTDAFVRQLNLLTPQQIREHREKVNLTPQQLAAALGVADAMVERLESGGMIQTRSVDNLMRLFFGLPNVREILMTHQISTLPETPAHAAP
jgi:DNA-binding transcriptional regulator YiaG